MNKLKINVFKTANKGISYNLSVAAVRSNGRVLELLFHFDPNFKCFYYNSFKILI